MKNWRKKIRYLTSLMALGTAAFLMTGQPVQAALEDWATTFGLVEKYGSDEEGYFIYGKGDVDSSCLDYEAPFDLMKTEISFKFEAHPFNEFYDQTWAYLAIYPEPNDSKWLYDYTYEENQEAGRIEFLLEQHTDGSMAFCLYQHPISTVLIEIPDFDFERVHTISFEEKLMGTFVVFDGMALGEVDLTKEMQKHIGENAGNSYLRVGGLQQFAFEHLKLTELEGAAEGGTAAEPEPERTEPKASDKPVRKLGSLASQNAEEEEAAGDEEQATEGEDQGVPGQKEAAGQTGSSLLWICVALAVVILLAVIVMIAVIVKRRKKQKQEKKEEKK